MVLNAGYAAIAFVWGGGALGYGLDFRDAIIAVLLAATILAIVGSGAGYISSKSGGTTYMNWRYAFGRIPSGVLGVALIMVTTGIGWYAVETWLGSVVITEMVPTGLFHNVLFNTFWFGIVMIGVSFVGYRALNFLTYIALPQHVWLIVVGFFIAIAVAGGMHGGLAHLMSILPAHPYSIEVGVTGAVGLYIAGAIMAGDYTRYAKNGKVAVFAWAGHMYLLFPLLVIGGVALVLVTGSYLVTQAMVDVGMGVAVLLIIVLGQTIVNAVNLYSGSLSLVNLVKIRRSFSAIINGVIGIIIAAYIAYTAGSSIVFFENFISFLGELLPAAVGVVLADFFLIKPYLKGIRKLEDRYDFTEHGKYPEINVNGLISFSAGAIVGVFVHWGIGAVNSLVVSFGLYLIIAYVCAKANVSYEIGQYYHKKALEKRSSSTGTGRR